MGDRKNDQSGNEWLVIERSQKQIAQRLVESG